MSSHAQIYAEEKYEEAQNPAEIADAADNLQAGPDDQAGEGDELDDCFDAALGNDFRQ